MSKFFDAADEIHNRLAAVPGLAGISLLVDRQKDIESEFNKVVGKQIGNLAIITWSGAPNEDPAADGPNLSCRYTVTLFSKPVIRHGDTPADDIIETIARALHNSSLTGSESYSDRVVVTGIDPIQSDSLLIFRINLSIPIQL